MRTTAPAPCGRTRSAHDSTRSTRTSRTALAALALLALGACAKSDATGPGMAPAEDKVPAISGLSVEKAGDVYLRGNLSVAASDPEGAMQQVVIDWGDGETATVTSDFGSISRSHDYTKAGTYNVTVTAIDAAGNKATADGSVKLDPLPHACIDVFKVVGACLDVHPDFEGVDIDIKVLDNSIYTATLSTSKSRIEAPIPVGGVLGQVKVALSSSFSKSKGNSYVRFQVYGCTLFLICTEALADKKFTW
jgi:PKD domain